MIVLNPPVIDILHGIVLNHPVIDIQIVLNHPVNHSEYVDFVWDL